MVALMNDDELTTLEQLRFFLEDTERVAVAILGKDECALGPPR